LVLTVLSFRVPYFGFKVLGLGRGGGWEFITAWVICIGLGFLFILKERALYKWVYVLIMLCLIFVVFNAGLLMFARS